MRPPVQFERPIGDAFVTLEEGERLFQYLVEASIPGRAAGYPNGSPTDPDERN